MKIPQTKRYSIYKNLVLEDKRSIKLDFKPDGRHHYVYRVTDYIRTEKEHYYGSHTPSKRYYNHQRKITSIDLIDEFWRYRTSSKFNTLLLENKESYKVKIIKVFDNPADKIIYEAFLHQYFDVKLDDRFWNKSNQTPFGFDTTGKKNNYIMTTEHKEKLYNIHKGKIVSEATKIKMKLNHADVKGTKHPMFGKKHSDEAKKKIGEAQKGSIPWNKNIKCPQIKVKCPHCNKEGGKSNMTRYHFNNCKVAQSCMV